MLTVEIAGLREGLAWRWGVAWPVVEDGDGVVKFTDVTGWPRLQGGARLIFTAGLAWC